MATLTTETRVEVKRISWQGWKQLKLTITQALNGDAIKETLKIAIPLFAEGVTLGADGISVDNLDKTVSAASGSIVDRLDKVLDGLVDLVGKLDEVTEVIVKNSLVDLEEFDNLDAMQVLELRDEALRKSDFVAMMDLEGNFWRGLAVLIWSHSPDGSTEQEDSGPTIGSNGNRESQPLTVGAPTR